jgi:hypothetical protein
VWLHGFGNIIENYLPPSEMIDVQPGGWIYRDESVRIDPIVYGLRTGIFSGTGNLVFNRFPDPAASAFSRCTTTCPPRTERTLSLRNRATPQLPLSSSAPLASQAPHSGDASGGLPGSGTKSVGSSRVVKLPGERIIRDYPPPPRSLAALVPSRVRLMKHSDLSAGARAMSDTPRISLPAPVG